MKVLKTLGSAVLAIGLAGGAAYAQTATPSPDPAAQQTPGSQDPAAQQTPSQQTPVQSPSQQTPSTPDPSTQQSPSTSPSQTMPQDSMGQAQDSQQAQTFSGKILKSKGGYVLRDEATNSEYKLDNDDQAKQFKGKNVKVTGTLDPASHTIHVTNIEMSKG
jgi:uncharacterized protein DUF5818